MKKLISFFLAFAALLCLSLKCFAEEDKYIPPEVGAYILTEASTGRVLSSYNENERLSIASVTKVMVLLIIAEEIKAGRLDFSDEVPVSAYANSMDGSVIWLEQGEIMTAGDMIKSLTISSANDACVALAEYISGSEEEFVKRMNKRAAMLGMKDTSFSNCVGYDDGNHYSTARDVAVMTAELFKYDYFSEFMLTRLSSVRTGTERETQLLNTNKLASTYDGILGGKTGTTDNAGYCLTECAERGGMKIISVVLGASKEDDRVSLSKYLLDSGFNEWQMFQPEIDTEKLLPIKVERGVAKSIELELEKSPLCVIPKGSGKNIEYVYYLPESITAPVKAGQIIGEVKAMLGGEVVFISDVLTKGETQELTFFKSFEILIGRFFKWKN